jgi:integrase/recombinase XerD
MELERITNQRELVSNVQGLPLNYMHVLKQFDKFKGDRKLSPDLIQDFLSLPKNKGEGNYSPSSIALRKTAIFQAIQRMTFDSRMKAVLTEESKKIKVAKIQRTIHSEMILSDSEIEKLIQGTKTIEARNWGEKFGNKKERYSLIIETLSKTGLRISELTGIKLSDCKKEGKFIFIKILGKGSKPRRIFIPEELFNRVKKAFNSKEFLFLSIRGKRMNRGMIYHNIKDLGIRLINREIHPHTFRHSFATKEIKKRKSVKAVQNYLGHSSSAITEQMYNHDEILPEDLFQ